MLVPAIHDQRVSIVQRLSGNDEGVETLLREQFSIWQELQRAGSKWTHELRRLEVQLRLAEWLANEGRYQEATEAYSAAAQFTPQLHKNSYVSTAFFDRLRGFS
jgi:hypothetical protein